MIIHPHVIQGSEEWLEMRAGRATASEASKVLTPTGKDSSSRIGYMRKLAREKLINDPMEFMGNKFTEWGQAMEPEARGVFEKETDLVVSEVGFCTRADDIVGFSPDGIIYHEGNPWKGLEIKCPAVDKHVQYIMEGILPPEYKLQVHWSLAASGLNSWYFMSYFPKLKPLIIEVEADEFTDLVKDAQDRFIIDYAEVKPAVTKAIMVTKLEEVAS